MRTAMRTVCRPTLHADLAAPSAGPTGEILAGQLHTRPRPTGLHALAAPNPRTELGPPFGKGRGKPDGWWIIVEPEPRRARDQAVAVPDLTNVLSFSIRGYNHQPLANQSIACCASERTARCYQVLARPTPAPLSRTDPRQPGHQRSIT